MEEQKKKRIKANDLKKAMRIFNYLKPFRVEYSIGVFFLIITALSSLAFPYLIAKLKASTLEDLDTNIALIIGLLIIQASSGFFRLKLFINVTEKSLAHIRLEVYTKLIQLPMNFFSKKRVGELNSRIASDTTQIQETLTSTLAEFFRQISMIVGGIIILAFASIKLTLFIIAVIPAVMIGAVIFGRFIRRFAKTVQQELAESNTIVEETLQGIQTVKAFVNEWFEIKRYGLKTKQVAKTAMKGGTYRAVFTSYITIAVFGAIVAVIWYAVKLLHMGEIDSEMLDIFFFYAMFIGGSVAGLANVYSNIQKTIGATEDLFEIIDNEAEPIQLKEIKKVEGFLGKLEFKQVEFAYPTRPDAQVLNSLSFSVEAGNQVALVGPSGGGKSTIIQLIMRFYDPGKGEILVDDKKAQDFELSELRNQMAIVPQDVLLFGGTVRENIAYGDPKASQAEIEEAAKKANAHEFIVSFPEGYETIVGERGIQLSGGQRQRVAIARAVLKDPKILLLDEATSSLDSESEKQVQEALETLMKGRTSIVIAHRLSTIRNADKILVISQGNVIEEGKHDTLSKQENGLYRKLSQNQFME